MKRSLIIAAIALAAPATAAAQSAAMVESAGHRVGESTVLHPVAGLDTGVVSNVFYDDVNPTTAAVMRVLARFDLRSETHRDNQLQVAAPDTPAPESGEGQTLDFKAGLTLVGEQYLDGEKHVRDQSNLHVTAHADVVVFPHSKTTFFASDNFIRDTRPQDFEDFGSLDRDINHLKVGIRYKPGSGSMRFGLRYENRLDLFESPTVTFADRIHHKGVARAEWQFLPITKFSAELSAGLFGQLGSSSAPHASSFPVRFRVGAASALTQSTTIRTHIGFGKGFYDSGPDFTNVLFGAEVGYRYSPVGRFTLGYRYDFFDAVSANFYRDHAVTLKVDQQLGRVVLAGSVGARLRGYRGIPMSLGAPNRDDLILNATVRGHYMVRDWLAIVGQGSAVADQTDYMYVSPVPDDPSYSRFEATVGVRAAY